MSQENIYLDLYERIIYNVPAKRIGLTSIGEYTILELLEYYNEQFHSAIDSLKSTNAIKRYRVYGDRLYLYLE